jgi:hypothetical protein
MTGQIGILNVGAGDTKLTFDKNNPAECIRSGRVITDMLRRGYALLIEVPDGNGGKAYTRVHEFRESTCEYIIADFDPIIAAKEDEANERNDEPSAASADGAADEVSREAPAKRKGGNRSIQPNRGKRTAVHASATAGIAVSRSAGG